MWKFSCVVEHVWCAQFYAWGIVKGKICFLISFGLELG